MYVHCVSKKVPTFKLSLTLSNLNWFSKRLHCWKAYEICYKTHALLPTSPVTLGMLLHYLGKLKCHFWQVFSKYERKCKQILVFSVFKIVTFCIVIANTISMSLLYTYLLLQSICGSRNSSQQTSLQCLSTINVVLSDEDKILMKFVFEEVHSKKVDRRISREKLAKAHC